MNTRLANYLTRRLRRETAREIVDIAVEREFLLEDESPVGGHHVRFFHPGPNSQTQSITAMVRELKQAARAGAGIGRQPKDHETDWHINGIQDSQTEQESGDTGEQRPAPCLPDGIPATELVRIFRAAAAPPQAVEVATALMVANSLASDDLAAKLNTVLKQPQPVISVSSDAEGFIKPFVNLLKRGMLLPGKVALSNGMRNSLDALNELPSTRWHAVHFRIEPNGHQIETKELYQAAHHPLPLLVIKEGGSAMPPLVECAAHFQLDCGPLTPDIVRLTMHIVLGGAPAEDAPFPKVEHLDLPDIALAIRPGVPVEHAVQILAKLAARASEDADRMHRRKASSPVETASNDSSSSRSDKRSGKSTGGEIIQPLRPGDGKSFVPTLETLSGFGDARDWALNLKDDLVLWREKDLSWEEMSTKLLLSGPPGTGKTSFAKALCNSLQIPLVATSVATWLEPGYLGDCIKRMSKAFEEARAYAPCILFIDEFDGISSRGRSSRHDDYWTTIINRLLELLDGASKSTGVVVVAATNNPHVIDPALLHSGRLEKHIAIPMPNINVLAEIIRYHLGNDLDEVVRTALNADLRPLGRESSADTDKNDAEGEMVGGYL